MTSDSADNALAVAVARLRAGDLVGMPTETVYGLAADARQEEAVAKIFSMKGRPGTNPLIVHVASAEMAERYAVLDDRARRLLARFAPGPLTIILPRRDGGGICERVSAGLETVGIRIPAHPVALALLRAFDGPLAAPSANRSNHISPTTAAHVREEFGDGLPVLDGGPCRVGIESTVLDLSHGEPTILRPGEVSRGAIEAVIGPVRTFAGQLDESTAARSPGQQRVHYAPRAPAWRFADEGEALAVAAESAAGAAVILFGEATEKWRRFKMIATLPLTPDVASRALYATLRHIDARSPAEIFVAMPPDGPAWLAVRDRLTRATRPIAARNAADAGATPS